MVFIVKQRKQQFLLVLHLHKEETRCQLRNDPTNKKRHKRVHLLFPCTLDFDNRIFRCFLLLLLLSYFAKLTSAIRVLSVEDTIKIKRLSKAREDSAKSREKSAKGERNRQRPEKNRQRREITSRQPKSVFSISFHFSKHFTLIAEPSVVPYHSFFELSSPKLT